LEKAVGKSDGWADRAAENPAKRAAKRECGIKKQEVATVAVALDWRSLRQFRSLAAAAVGPLEIVVPGV
jgi:hypothetical protein